MKKIISLIILIFVVFSFCACSIGNSQNKDNNGDEGGGATGDETFVEHLVSKVEFEKLSFDADEDIKVKYSFGIRESYANVASAQYYDIFLKDAVSGEEYLIRHVDENISAESLSVSGDDFSTKNLTFKHSETITLPKDFLSRSTGHVALCFSMAFFVDDSGGVSPTYVNQEYILRYGTAPSVFTYEERDGKIELGYDEKNYFGAFNSVKESLKNYVAHHIYDFANDDTAFVNIDDDGYDINSVTADFYFGRSYRGSTEQHMSSAKNIGKASIFLESDSGEKVLLATDKEDYISSRRVERASYDTLLISYAAYKKDSCIKITIPKEFFTDDCGILFLSVAGDNGEKLSEVPLQYRVEGERVYLSRRFIMHKDDNSNLDFHLGQVINEEQFSRLNPSSTNLYNTFTAEAGENRYVFNKINEGYIVSQIGISNEGSNLYGININSTKEEFIEKFESLGYTVTEYRDTSAENNESAEPGSCLVAYRDGVAILFNLNYVVHFNPSTYSTGKSIILTLTPMYYSSTEPALPVLFVN